MNNQIWSLTDRTIAKTVENLKIRESELITQLGSHHDPETFSKLVKEFNQIQRLLEACLTASTHEDWNQIIAEWHATQAL